MRTVEYYVADRIIELCRKRNMSKYRLAKLTGLTQTALGNIIKLTSIPTIGTIESISQAFDMTVAQFFAEEEKFPDLTEEQKELLLMWHELDENDKHYISLFIQCILEYKREAE